MIPLHVNAAPRSPRPALPGGTKRDGRQQQEATCEGGRPATLASERCDCRLAGHAQSRRLGGLHRERDAIEEADPGRSLVRAQGQVAPFTPADAAAKGHREAREGLRKTPYTTPRSARLTNRPCPITRRSWMRRSSR